MNRATEVCNQFVECLQIVEEIKKQLKTLFLKFPNDIKQKYFSEVFSKEFGQSLNFCDYKTSCLLEICIRLPHIFKIKNSCGLPAFFPASSIGHSSIVSATMIVVRQKSTFQKMFKLSFERLFLAMIQAGN